MHRRCRPKRGNADALKAWLLQYGAHSEALRVEMAEWACMMANGSPCYGMYCALNVGRMLAAGKEPGICPLACGESFMHLLARCALIGEPRALARDTCNNVNLSDGLQSGIEGNLHAIRIIWPESAGWAFDPSMTAEPQNIFQQLLDGAERKLAQAEDTPPDRKSVV